MRNYGIDLLRLVLMFMVCMLHTLGQGGVLRACVEGSAGYYVFWFLEILAYCAVDGFALISGYTAKDRKQNYVKIVDMWFQAFFYAFIVTIVLWMIGIGEFDVKAMIKAAMPVTFSTFWYFTAYVALFFAMPILNRFLFSVDENGAKKSLILIVALFSGLGILRDPFNSNYGYSAIWLVVLYCVGVLAKRINLFGKKKTITLVTLWGCCILSTWGVRVFLNIGRLTNYVSPTILLSAVIMVVLFSRMQISGKIIGKVAPLAFGIYLFQLNSVLWNDVLKGAVAPIASMNIVQGVICAFAVASVIFISGLIVEAFRAKVASAIKLTELSKKAVILADGFLEKTVGFLK